MIEFSDIFWVFLCFTCLVIGARLGQRHGTYVDGEATKETLEALDRADRAKAAGFTTCPGRFLERDLKKNRYDAKCLICDKKAEKHYSGD